MSRHLLHSANEALVDAGVAEAQLVTAKLLISQCRKQIRADHDTFRDVDILDDPIGAAAELEAGKRNCAALLDRIDAFTEQMAAQS